MSCGVGRSRRSLDSELLWLWCRPSAVAPIKPLAWEPPYAVGVALKKSKAKKRKKKKERKKRKKQTLPKPPKTQKTTTKEKVEDAGKSEGMGNKM